MAQTTDLDSVVERMELRRSMPRTRREQVRQIFLDALAALAWADGQVDEAELQSIDVGLRSVGLLPRNESFAHYVEQVEVSIDDVMLEFLVSRWEREALVTLMCVVGMADGEYLEVERALIEGVADRLDVDPRRFAELETIVARDLRMERELSHQVPDGPDASETDVEGRSLEGSEGLDDVGVRLLGPEASMGNSRTSMSSGLLGKRARDAAADEVVRGFLRGLGSIGS